MVPFAVHSCWNTHPHNYIGPRARGGALGYRGGRGLELNRNPRGLQRWCRLWLRRANLQATCDSLIPCRWREGGGGRRGAARRHDQGDGSDTKHHQPKYRCRPAVTMIRLMTADVNDAVIVNIRGDHG
jgi:hypothetical protein